VEHAPRTPDDADTELVGLIQRGFRYALALTHDSALAEELAHDAFVSMMRSGDQRSAPYLFTVIRSRFVDQRRHEEVLPMASLEDVDESELARLLDEATDDVDREALDRALARLRPMEREVLMLACVEEFTCAQIAEIFGRPRGSVTSLLFRAQQKLRQLVLRGSSEASS
jgi:RNA polymerase sigma-70 factor (ECF subfamily)